MSQNVIPYTFTAWPKAYREVFYRLSDTGKSLLFFLVDQLLGWHKDQETFSSSVICEKTGVSESSLRRARKELEDRGILRCELRLVAGRTLPSYHLIVPNTPPRPEKSGDEEGAQPCPPRRQRRGTPVTGGGGMGVTSGTHVKNVPTTLVKEQQQDVLIAPTRPADCPAEVTALAPVPTSDDEPSRSFQKEQTWTEGQGRLVARLESVGVNRSMSRRLVQTVPKELILTALNRLPFRQAKNPAAYLVRELLDGGYTEPVARQVTRTREEVHARRKTEEREEQARREREGEDLARYVDEILAKHSGEARAKLLEEAKGRLGGWAARFTVDEEDPVLRGALCDLVLERWPMGEGRRVAA